MKLGLCGGGLSAQLFVRSLRENNYPIDDITIIDKDKLYIPRKYLVDYLFCNFKKEIIDLEEFSSLYKANFLKERILKIELSKRRVTTYSNQRLNFDILVISLGIKSKDLAIKGQHKEGFFYISELGGDDFKTAYKISKHIVIYVSTFVGVRLLVNLVRFGKDKEIKVITSNLNFLNTYQDKLKDYLLRNNIDIYEGCAIEEVIGDSSIRATRVNIPKIFASELVIVDSGFVHNTDMIEEDFTINNYFLSPFDKVYFLGDISYYRDTDYFLLFNSQEIERGVVFLINHIFQNSVLENTPYMYTFDDYTSYLDKFFSELC